MKNYDQMYKSRRMKKRNCLKHGIGLKQTGLADVWESETSFRFFGTLQHTATNCKVLQHTATHCNIMGFEANIWIVPETDNSAQVSSVESITKLSRSIIDDRWSTVILRRWNRTDRRYRPWQTDRSINRWISVDICICVGTISHHLLDHWLLGRWLSRTIIHHCWDHRSIGHWSFLFFCKFVGRYRPSTNFFFDSRYWPSTNFFVWIDLDGDIDLFSDTIIRTDHRYRP